MNVTKPSKAPKQHLYLNMITGQILGQLALKDVSVADVCSIGKHLPTKISVRPNEKGWEIYKNRQMITQVPLDAGHAKRRETFFKEMLEQKMKEDAEEGITEGV